MNFNWFDISLLVLVLMSVVSGFQAGFARVTIGFVSAIVGLWLAFWSYRIPAEWLKSVIPNTTVDNVLGFVIIFAVVVAIGGLVALVLSKLFNWIGLSWFDHLSGRRGRAGARCPGSGRAGRRDHCFRSVSTLRRS